MEVFGHMGDTHMGKTGDTLWQEGDIRVCRISTMLTGIDPVTHNPVVDLLPPSCGLGIEHACGDGHWYVIAFVRPCRDGGCNYESIGTRIEDSCHTWGDVKSFRRALAFAMQVVGMAREAD